MKRAGSMGWLPIVVHRQPDFPPDCHTSCRLERVVPHGVKARPKGRIVAPRRHRNRRGATNRLAFSVSTSNPFGEDFPLPSSSLFPVASHRPFHRRDEPSGLVGRRSSEVYKGSKQEDTSGRRYARMARDGPRLAGDSVSVTPDTLATGRST